MKAKQFALVLGLPLTWACLVLFQAGPSSGFWATGLLGLVLAALLLGFFIAAFTGIVSRRWRLMHYFGVALLIVFSSSLAADRASVRQREASVAAAQPIIVAAERFREASGTYPRTLDDLVPEYLPAEPRPKMGFRERRFVLSSNGDRFRVMFALPKWRVCVYDSESQQWDIRD